MAIKIAGIDLASEIVDLRYQLLRTQMILDAIINETNELRYPSPEVIEKIEVSVVEQLKTIYPDAGITKKDR